MTCVECARAMCAMCSTCTYYPPRACLGRMRSSLQLQSEIGRLEEAERRRREAALAPTVRSTEQWLRTYGRPKAMTEGMTSTFAPLPRVYGGTEHHSAFRSSATVMKEGRCIK